MASTRSSRRCGRGGLDLSPIVIASEAKQSISPLADCFVALLLAMTTVDVLHLLHPAPFSNEQGRRLGRLPQRLQIDILVEAVHRRTARAKAQAWDVVVQPIE